MIENAMKILSNRPIIKLLTGGFILLFLSYLAFINGEYIGRFIYSLLS